MPIRATARLEGALRQIFVGDVQGCSEELRRLLDQVHFDPASDRIEPAGDLVNRGPDSLGTLRLLRSLDAGGVLGNHDLHLLRVAAGGREPRRSDAFDDVLNAPDREPLLEWLAARPFAKTGTGTLLVHAGLHPKWVDPVAQLEGLDPLERHADSDFATLVRRCTADGLRPRRQEDAEDPAFRPWYEHWRNRDNRTIVFGHWAQRGLVHESGLRGLDTGCVWGGQLTAWIAEEDRLVQVPAAHAYASPGG